MTFLNSAAAALVLVCALAAHAADGMVVVRSPHSAVDTALSLLAVVQAQGLKLFVRIDHAAGGATVGTTLRPTEVFIFGDPKGGTPQRECAHTVGIDRTVILYCAAGGRSALAGMALQALGYKSVFNLGALQSWIDSGGAVEHEARCV